MMMEEEDSKMSDIGQNVRIFLCDFAPLRENISRKGAKTQRKIMPAGL